MENIITKFLKKQVVIAFFLCIAFAVIGFLSVEGFNWKDLKYSGNAITTDELAHIPSGYYYLKTGKYFLNVEHPPLIKDISALPLLFLNPVLPKISSDTIFPEGYAWENYPPKEFIYSKNLEIRNDEWDWGRVFLFNPQNNPELIVFWARFSVILFNALFLFILYLLFSKVWNKRVALISLFLIVFSQFSIAHGSIVTMDFMSSVLQMLAIVSFSTYLKNFAEDKKTMPLFIITSSFFSLALLAKFSSLLLLPSMFIGGSIYVAITKKNCKYLLNYFFKIISLCLVILIFITIFYYFHTFNMDSKDMVAQFNHYYPTGLPFGIKELLVKLVRGSQVFKGLAQYISGVIMVFTRMNVAYQEIFFMGKVYGSEGAGLLYFPILYITKLSIGLLILNLLAILLVAWKSFSAKGKILEKIRKYFKNPLPFLLLLFAFFYAITTFSSNLQIGLRLIMPIILAVTILTAMAVDLFWDKKLLRIKFSYIFYVLFLAILLSVFSSFPNYISYFNAFAGGTDNGYMIATDSNFDWGQDAKKLVKYVKDNNIKNIYIDIEGNVPLQWYLGDVYRVFNAKKDALPEPGSYLALSISRYEIYNAKYKLLENNLIQKVGKTILIFQVPK